MCGIIGCSSKNVIDFSKIRLGLLLADDRGGHSCGLVNDKRDIVKQVADAKEFINDSKDEVKLPKENKTFIAHTRFATKGAKTVDNQHPFSFGNITGVHNGTLDNFDVLKKKFKDSLEEDVESDSKLLYYIINEKGLKGALKMFRGTMGLSWFSDESGGRFLNLYRFDKPMCYGYLDDELWFASLKEYLDTLGCSKIKSLTEHTHYKIQDGQIISAKQLPADSLPQISYTQRDDEDPQFEKKSKKGTTKKKTTGTNSGNSCSVNTGTTKDKKFKFHAPLNANGDYKGDDIVLWWFSVNDPNILYIEDTSLEDTIYYDLSLKYNRDLLKDDYPNLSDYMLSEYTQISMVNEIRNEHEQEVQK